MSPPFEAHCGTSLPVFPSFPFSAVMPVVCTLPHGACLPDGSPFPSRTIHSPYGVQGVAVSFYHSDSATLSTVRTNSPLFSRTQKLGEKRKRKMFTNITLSGATQQCRAIHRPVRSTPLCSLVGPGRLAVAVHDAGVLPCAWRQASRQDGGTWQWRAHTRARDTRPRSAPARPCASRRPAAHAASLKCG